MVGVNELAGLSLAATIIVFLASLVIVVACRKRFVTKNSKHQKFMWGGALILIVIWVIMFALFAWSWWWVIKSAPVGQERSVLNLLFGFTLLMTLLWPIVFFICNSTGPTIMLLVLLVISSVGIAVYAALIKNYWIMAYAIVLAVFFGLTTIGVTIMYKCCNTTYLHDGMIHDKKENVAELEIEHKEIKIDRDSVYLKGKGREVDF